MSKQSTSHLFMIEPESFYVNEQTAFTNHYQKEVSDESPQIIAKKALYEFHNLKNKIEEKGIKVINTPAASSASVAELVFSHLF